jgi:hypothetical protein
MVDRRSPIAGLLSVKGTPCRSKKPDRSLVCYDLHVSIMVWLSSVDRRSPIAGLFIYQMAAAD